VLVTTPARRERRHHRRAPLSFKRRIFNFEQRRACRLITERTGAESECEGELPG
jgi:hypothetical protein